MWWRDALTLWNGAPLCKRAVEIQVETDALKTGWGGTTLSLEASGTWTKEVSFQPSNYCELLAVIKTLQSFKNSTTRKSGASTVRQHHNSLLHKQFGGTQSSYDPVDEGDIYPCTQEPNGFVSKILSRVPQLSCRQTVKTIIPCTNGKCIPNCSNGWTRDGDHIQ